jgi:hypothetical protein
MVMLPPASRRVTTGWVAKFVPAGRVGMFPLDAGGLVFGDAEKDMLVAGPGMTAMSALTLRETDVVE